MKVLQLAALFGGAVSAASPLAVRSGKFIVLFLLPIVSSLSSLATP
jgi:hypothetical protein